MQTFKLFIKMISKKFKHGFKILSLRKNLSTRIYHELILLN